ncbi:MAG: APC family permease [Gemmatimonadaceae bacterium]
MTTVQAAPPVNEEANAELSEFGYGSELRRSLSLADLLVYGLVFIVPIAPFAIFGIVFNSSKGMVALTYVVGLIAMVFTALSYREMSRAFPIAGSVYAYAGRGISPTAGFLAGWAILLDYLLIPTLCYVVGAAALRSVVPQIPQAAWVIGFVVFNTAINLLGIETTARASRIFLVGELIVLALFVVFGAIAVSRGVNGAHWTIAPFFTPKVFHIELIFSALSVAVLSFLGFDAISTLAEEAKGGARVVGRATMITLCIAAGLFILQTYIAALLVPGQTEFTGDTATNDAFYTIAGMAGGASLKITVAVAVALAAAIANALVAQAATSRLLFAMARDGQLPRFLAHIHPVRQVPQRALLFVSAVSLILGLFFVGQVGLISSLVNFGALFSFLLLHVSVVVYFLFRQRTGAIGLHLVSPAIGFIVIAFVLMNADVHAKIGGLVWLAVGVVIVIGLRISGRSTELKLEG